MFPDQIPGVQGAYIPSHLAFLNSTPILLAKGMVSVDYRQVGREIALRPSMIKFQALEWSEIEIVWAFDRPRLFYLNRPLIMVLEGLGVKYRVFNGYQDRAVQEAQHSKDDYEQTGRLLDSFGLGTSFRLSSVIQT
jgi:RNA-dependent RNA polymerase